MSRTIQKSECRNQNSEVRTRREGRQGRRERQGGGGDIHRLRRLRRLEVRAVQRPESRIQKPDKPELEIKNQKPETGNQKPELTKDGGRRTIDAVGAPDRGSVRLTLAETGIE